MSAPRIDIGHGVSIERYSCQHGPGGYLIYFDEEAPCGVSICSECSGGTWTVEQEEPLTISPSIHALALPAVPETGYPGTADHHGFIREGKWVPA